MAKEEKKAIWHRISKLGGDGIMTEEKAIDTSIGCMRVLDLMQDNRWHKVQAICSAAGGRGGFATEGLRRMRELRQCGYDIERVKLGPGTWAYRIPPKVTELVQLSLFDQPILDDRSEMWKETPGG